MKTASLRSPKPPRRPAAAFAPLVVATAALAAALSLAVAPCAAQEASEVASYYWFVHWMSVARPDRAIEQFADDAVVIAGPRCTAAAPCIGKPAIVAGYFAALNAKQVGLPLTAQRFDGRFLRTQGEQVIVTEPGDAPARLLAGHVLDLRGGRIATLRQELDTSDAATAAFAARHGSRATLAGTAVVQGGSR